MVTRGRNASIRRRGSLLVELLVGLAILTGALLPLAYSFASEGRLARAAYQRAVAMEIVDGEMEALVAGEWRAMPAGTREYPFRAGAATNLPPGRMMITIETNRIRLEWVPEVRNRGPLVSREAMLK